MHIGAACDVMIKSGSFQLEVIGWTEQHEMYNATH